MIRFDQVLAKLCELAGSSYIRRLIKLTMKAEKPCQIIKIRQIKRCGVKLYWICFLRVQKYKYVTSRSKVEEQSKIEK